MSRIPILVAGGDPGNDLFLRRRESCKLVPSEGNRADFFGEHIFPLALFYHDTL